MDKLCHPSEFSLALLIADIFLPGVGMIVNASFAPGNYDLKLGMLGLFVFLTYEMCVHMFFLIVPLIPALLLHAFAIYHGWRCYQLSKR